MDLFFALSGFILTHTYLRRLGPAVRVRGTVDFWWLRLARIYPVHLVMLFIAGGAVFLCEADLCVASAPSSQTFAVSTCKAVAKNVGAVAVFLGGVDEPLHLARRKAVFVDIE